MSFALALVPTLLAALILAIASVRWRHELFMALPFLAILNGVPITVWGSIVRLDQLAACLLVIPLAMQVLTGARKLRVDAVTWCLAGLLIANVAASVINSPARSYSLAQCANLASAWLIYVVLLNFIDTRDELATFFRRCLVAAAIAGGLGIAAFTLAIVGLPVGGADVSASAAESLTNAYGATGTMFEPNIFGSFMAAMLTLSVALIAVGAAAPSSARSTLVRWTAAISAVGLLLSFTRSAWLGALVGLGCIVLLGGRTFGMRAGRVVKPAAAMLVVVGLLLVLPGSMGEFFRFKVLNIVNLASRTATLRLVMYTLALDQTIVHPFVGWGTFTFAPLVAQGADFARFDHWRDLWIGNFVLLALHDTGAIGLVLWIGLLWSLLARGVRTMRAVRARDTEYSARILGLTAAVVSLLIPFLATSGFSLGYPWILMGLLGASVRLAPEDSAS